MVPLFAAIMTAGVAATVAAWLLFVVKTGWFQTHCKSQQNHFVVRYARLYQQNHAANMSCVHTQISRKIEF